MNLILPQGMKPPDSPGRFTAFADKIAAVPADLWSDPSALYRLDCP